MKLKKKNKIWFVVPLAFASLTTIFPIAARCKKVEENKDDKQGGDSSSNSDSNKKDNPSETIIRNFEELTNSVEALIKENKENLDLKQNVERLNLKLEEIKNKTNEYKSSNFTKEKDEEVKRYIDEYKNILEKEKSNIDKIKNAIVIKKGFIERITKIEDEIYNSSTWFFVKRTNHLTDEQKKIINTNLISSYLQAKKIERLLNIEKISELQNQFHADLSTLEKVVTENKDLIISKFIAQNEEKIKKLEQDNLNENESVEYFDLVSSKKEIISNFKKYIDFLKEKKEIIFYSFSLEPIIQIYNEFINLWKQSKFKELKNSLSCNLENYPPFYSESDNNRSQETLELQKMTDELKKVNDNNIDTLKQEIIKVFKQYSKITKIWFEKTTIKNECLVALSSYKKLNLSKDSQIVKSNEYLNKNIDTLEKDVKNIEEFLNSSNNEVKSLNESLELSTNINKWILRIKNSNRYLKVINLYLNEKWEIFLKSKSEEIKKIDPNLNDTYKQTLVELLNLFEFEWEKPQSEFNKKFTQFEQLFNKLNETIEN